MTQSEIGLPFFFITVFYNSGIKVIWATWKEIEVRVFSLSTHETIEDRSYCLKILVELTWKISKFWCVSIIGSILE